MKTGVSSWALWTATESGGRSSNSPSLTSKSVIVCCSCNCQLSKYSMYCSFSGLRIASICCSPWPAARSIFTTEPALLWFASAYPFPFFTLISTFGFLVQSANWFLFTAGQSGSHDLVQWQWRISSRKCQLFGHLLRKWKVSADETPHGRWFDLSWFYCDFLSYVAVVLTVEPVLIDTNMTIVCADWNHNGSCLAVAGKQAPSGDEKKNNVIQFFSHSGEVTFSSFFKIVRL